MLRDTLTLIGFGFLAFLVTIVPGGIWSALLAINLANSPSVPWSTVAMGLTLILLWSYLNGMGPPAANSHQRRSRLRAVRLPRRVFLWTTGAGLLGLVALTGLWIVLIQLARSPGNALPDFSKYPSWTVAISLITASVLGGVTEEAGFRGYFQGALERRMGGPLAIVITALCMAPAHALTQGFVWNTFVFYLMVDAMLGLSAWLTGSILPGIIVHSVGLLTFFSIIWPGDKARTLVATNGTDQWFWIHVAQAAVFAILSVLAFRHAAREHRNLKENM